jgi:hypothetical protein
VLIFVLGMAYDVVDDVACLDTCEKNPVDNRLPTWSSSKARLMVVVAVAAEAS